MIKVEGPCGKDKHRVELNSNSYGQGLAKFCFRRDLSEGDRAKVDEVVNSNIVFDSSRVSIPAPSA
jgi:hypothetical protein